MRTPLGWLRDRLATEARTVTSADYWKAWAAGEIDGPPASVGNVAGVRVDHQTALSISAVWACVSLIADAVATMPLDVLVPDGQAMTPLRPRPTWLDQPNEEQTRVEFVFQQLVSLLLDGTAYVYTPRNARGDVVEAWVVNPKFVFPRRERATNGRMRRVYWVYPTHATGPQQTTPPDDFKGATRLESPLQMFQIDALTLPGWLRGLSPLDVARTMFGGAIANQEMGARFYGQGMNASGVIEVPEDLTPEEARGLKQDFHEANASIRRMHLPPVLTGGATWRQISISPEQAQFLEARKFSVNDIARWYRVPPHLVGDVERSTSWGSGIEQQGIGFVQYTLRPWIDRLEQAYRRYLLMFAPPGARAKFDFRDLVKGDLKAQTEYWLTMRVMGAMNVDQIRGDQGLDPLPDGLGQTYIDPTAMQAMRIGASGKMSGLTAEPALGNNEGA